MVRFYTVILVLISFYGYGQVYDNVDEIENSTNQQDYQVHFLSISLPPH
jgi:hypothetical protein